MKVVYTGEEILKDTISIFLAGPSPRSNSVPSWRPEAIAILEGYGFNGVVYTPEDRDSARLSYDSQVLWEREAIESSSAVLFWIPRDLKDLPAFTTNVEFGKFIPSGKAFYGRPDSAPKNKYLDWFYNYETSRTHCSTLEETITQCMNYLKEA